MKLNQIVPESAFENIFWNWKRGQMKERQRDENREIETRFFWSKYFTTLIIIAILLLLSWFWSK